MGCGQSKDEAETSHARIKIKGKSKKSSEPTGKNAQLIPQQPHLEERETKNTLSKGNEEMGCGESSIEELICDGMSGRTEYFSPRRSNDLNKRGTGSEDFDEEKKEKSGKIQITGDDGYGNGNLSIEGLISDGLSGKTEFYSPKKSNDEVEVEDKEVLVEEKTGEGNTGKTEEATEDGSFGAETEFSTPMKSNDEDKYFSSKESETYTKIHEFSSPKKSNGEVKELLSNEKDTTVHVPRIAFNTLLSVINCSWWRTQEI